MLLSESVKLVRGAVFAVGYIIILIHTPSDFERFTPYVGELRKKQHVTSQSLEKIEDGRI